MKKTLIAFLVLMLAMLACGTPAKEYELRGWTVTPSLFANTSTAIIPTQTPFIIEITNTPEPTRKPVFWCVSATVAVNLRPSASDNNYPIAPLLNGTKVQDLGGRDGVWWFVRVDTKEGWLNSDYIEECG